MLKKITFIFGSALLLLFAMPSLAFLSSDAENNLNYQNLRVYNYDFDILLLDVAIPDNNGEADVLQALSVYNTRTANYTDISKITLWFDDGDGIWQGYMIDNKIADAVKIDSRRWVFSNLNVAIPVGGLHVYISAETDTDVTTDRRMQFSIDRLIDANSDGAYNSGDVGLFVGSANDGPVGDSFVSNFVYSLENRSGDVLPPKVAISNIKNNNSFKIADEFVISGFSKDRMRGSTSSIRISLVPTGNNPDWKDANSLTTNFATWDYTFSDLVVGDYDLQTFASDGDGNSVISDLITINFAEPIIEPEEPIEPEVPVEPTEPEVPVDTKPVNINNGDLVQAIGDYKVYVVNGDYKRWIQSAEIFNYYPHFNFSIVKEISQNELEYFTESWLVRADGGEKVYEINTDKTKHWINMTAEKFSQSGRNWDMVYIINEQEKDFYATGVDVTK